MTAEINEIENKLSQYISEVQKEKTSVEKYLAQLISKKDKAGYDELIDLDQEISEFKSIISDTKKLHDDLVHQYHHVSSRHLDEGVVFDAEKKLGVAVEKQEQLSSKDEVESDYIYKLLHKNVSHARVLDENKEQFKNTSLPIQIVEENDNASRKLNLQNDLTQKGDMGGDSFVELITHISNKSDKVIVLAVAGMPVQLLGGANDNNEATLYEKLTAVKIMGDGNFIIPLQVDAGTGQLGGFSNHFASLFINKRENNIKITFADPTGRNITNEIMQLSYSIFDSCNLHFDSYLGVLGSGLQKVSLEVLGSNCGVFTAHILESYIKNTKTERCDNQVQSEKLGDSLREIYLQDIFSQKVNSNSNGHAGLKSEHNYEEGDLKNDLKQLENYRKTKFSLLYDKDELDLLGFVNVANIIYNRMQKHLVDMLSYPVDQGFYGIISLSENDKLGLGTHNLQQCVAVAILGTKDSKCSLGLAHFDRFTTPDSLKDFLREFDEINDIIIYGARNIPQANISCANIKMVAQQVMDNKDKVSKIYSLFTDLNANVGSSLDFLASMDCDKDFTIKNKKLKENIIIKKNSTSLTIIEDVFANKNKISLDIQSMARHLIDSCDKTKNYDKDAAIIRSRQLMKSPFDENVNEQMENLSKNQNLTGNLYDIYNLGYNNAYVICCISPKISNVVALNGDIKPDNSINKLNTLASWCKGSYLVHNNRDHKDSNLNAMIKYIEQKVCTNDKHDYALIKESFIKELDYYCTNDIFRLDDHSALGNCLDYLFSPDSPVFRMYIISKIKKADQKLVYNHKLNKKIERDLQDSDFNLLELPVENVVLNTIDLGGDIAISFKSDELGYAFLGRQIPINDLKISVFDKLNWDSLKNSLDIHIVGGDCSETSISYYNDVLELIASYNKEEQINIYSAVNEVFHPDYLTLSVNVEI